MKKVTFAIPDNYAVPEGIAEGDVFEVSATLRHEGDSLCLVAIDDTPLPGYEKDHAKGRKANFTERYMGEYTRGEEGTI